MGATFPQWQGFELAPRGHLLEQLIDLHGDMGIAYERMVDFRKDFHFHDRLSFICPRGACVVEIKTRRQGAAYRLTSGDVLVLPRRHAHDITARSSVFDALALYPAAGQLASVARHIQVSARALERFTGAVRRLRRSGWLDHLLVEYFSRRVLASRSSRRQRARELAFFESEITREVFRIGGLWKDAAGKGEKSPARAKVADRALQFIEANLFAPIGVGDIAKHAYASPATLLRHFVERTGVTPLKYVRRRRLDEARSLLQKGTHSVTEVSVLVGYNSPGAFCEAFRNRFGRAPSTV